MSLLHGVDVGVDQMVPEDEVDGNIDDGDDGDADGNDDGCGEENDCELFSNLSSGQGAGPHSSRWKYIFHFLIFLQRI